MNESKIRNYFLNVKYKFPLLFMLAFTIAFQSCMSPNLVTLEPQTGETRWYKGNPITEFNQNTHKIEFKYLGSSDDRHQFMVTFVNYSDGDVTIDYSNFSVRYFTPSSSGYELEYKTYPDDPEQKISALQKSILQEKDYRASDNFVSGIRLFTRLLGDFADRTPEEEAKRREENKKSDESDYIREETYRKNLADKNLELEYWKNSYLRRTTLRQGESVSGFILLPVSAIATELILLFMNGNLTNEVKYNLKPL